MSHEAIAAELAYLRKHIAELEATALPNAEEHDSIHDDRYLLRALLMTSPDYVYFKDTQSRYVKLTIAHAQLMGFDHPRDVIGKTDFELFPREAAERFYQEEQLILAGLEVVEREAFVPASDGSTIWLLESKLPLRNAAGAIIGLMGVSRNITRRMEVEQQLRQRETELQAVVEQQELLINTIRELSTPVIPIADRILVVPLIGAMTSDRSAQVTERLLAGVQEQRADVVIIDITGVPVIDTGVANHLLQTTRAVALLGARCVLVGISPEIAQTVVQLGIDLSALVTRSSLQDGIVYALAQQGRKITG